MNCLHPTSLAATLDALAEAFFFKVRIPVTERNAAIGWIVGRQGLPGAYADMFAPTAKDLRGIRLFTGERVRSGAGIGHLLGEEACRILHTLPSPAPMAQTALRRAVAGMCAQLEDAARRGYSTDVYCCGTCASGYWRNLATGLLPKAEERLQRGLVRLKALRRGDGQWQRFPFYHTSLALTEIGPALAKSEMQYAATRWQKLLPRLTQADDPFARRRAEVGRRLMELCG